MKKLIAIAVAVVFLLTMATPVSAATIDVYPGDSIQTAVDSASPGDEIIVHAGEYHQSVKIGKNNITLKGVGAILDGDDPADDGTTFLWLDGNTITDPDWKISIWLSAGVSGVTITGFEIRDYGEWGMAIWLERFSHDNRVIKNELTGSTMVGIMVSTSNGNLIMKNKVSNSFGIVLEQQSHYNEVIENKITDSAMAGIILDEDSTYNIIEKNKVSNSGMVGIAIGDSHNNEVLNNKITDSAQFGIALGGSSSGNLIKGNKVSGSGTYDLCELALTVIDNSWENNNYDTSNF